MEIQTKFSIGDKAWYMHENKPTQVSVEAIYVFRVDNGNDYTRYNCKDVLRPVTWLDHEGINEFQLESSKEILISKL